MVARHRQLGPRGPLHHQFAKHIGHDGRLIDRVGSPLEELDSLGDVVHSRKVMAHQLTRDVGCQTGPRVVPRTPEKYSNHRLHGQHHRGSVHKQAGGTHSERLCQLTWEVLMTAKDSGMTLRASHIAGKLNVMADALSRGQMDPNEWALSQKTCNRIFEIFGKPMVDLFATAENTKLQIFCSRQFHPRAHHIDAMSFPWNNLEAYAFPPLCMIGQVLRKIRHSRGRVILIAPFWPRRPWFGELLQLLMDTPAILPDTPHLLSQRRGTLIHPDIKGLQLVAWKLSGLPFDRGAFRKRLPRSRPTPGGQQPLLLTIPDYASSGNGATTDRWVHPRQQQGHLPAHQGDGEQAPPNQATRALVEFSAALQTLTKPPYEPMASASLASLTKKTLFLIALASARRRSCLHALSTKQNHIRFENHGVRMVPDPAFLAKNQVLSFLPGDIFIPEIKSLSSIAEDKLWCPVRALKWYLNKTQHLRGTTTTLFILPRAPYSAASKTPFPDGWRSHPPVYNRHNYTESPRHQGSSGLNSPFCGSPSGGHSQGSSLANANNICYLLPFGLSTG
ncbi:hypothetical protein BSL78_28123 [Apostichopus japonicus]|uniref:Uncharacterized protein n=1 Tax=Stichopus japonicus TaxID=307972 RepID=A0A2G8JH35_STIJA|nr:hypothetical protein BSL78_28123 [Apostichopus japonicus]